MTWTSAQGQTTRIAPAATKTPRLKAKKSAAGGGRRAYAAALAGRAKVVAAGRAKWAARAQAAERGKPWPRNGAARRAKVPSARARVPAGRAKVAAHVRAAAAHARAAAAHAKAAVAHARPAPRASDGKYVVLQGASRCVEVRQGAAVL